MERTYYLNKIISKKNNGLVKVITGIKGCGKSYLLFNLFYSWLLSAGIPEESIITIKLNELPFQSLRDPISLRDYIHCKITKLEVYYILIDDLSTLDGYEFILNELNNNLHDVYLTGSNSMFLSDRISTLLRGRDSQIKLYPLTFKELYKGDNLNDELDNYLIYGGMPYLLNLNSYEERVEYLKSIVDTVYIKDIDNRYRINKIDILKEVIKLLCYNIGSYTNIHQIEDTLRSKSIKVTDDTLSSYIYYLLESFLFKKVIRYDIKDNRYLSQSLKYYCIDIGLRNAYINFNRKDTIQCIENVVYLELLSRDYLVDVGVTFNSNKKLYEIDFIARKGSKQYYIQVTDTIDTNDKLLEVVNPFKLIKDNFRKIIITYEKSYFTTLEDGYERINLTDFLLNADYLK